MLGTSSTSYNDFFSKSYSGLPSHTMIAYTITYWTIDNWSVNQDRFGIGLDGASITLFTFSAPAFFENLCGGSTSNDLRNNRLFGRATHSSSALTVKFTSYLSSSSSVESFGVRDINLLFVTSGASAGYCGLSYMPLSTYDSSYQCPCPEGYYQSGASCLACHINCASCYGSGTNRCYQCKPGNSLIVNDCVTCYTGCAVCSGTGANQCQSCLTGYFLFNGTTCLPSCPSPLIQAGNCANTCSPPCSNSDYYYWDGTCSSTCSSPLMPKVTTGSVNMCQFPCKTGNFLYWDGTCSPTCTLPLIQSIYKGKSFCNFPCSTNQYAYHNGSCSSVCTPPFVAQTRENRLFCSFPCNINQTLFWNGSCLASCPTPLIQTNVGGDLFCTYPCRSFEYLYWDGSCETFCRTLLTPRIEGSTRLRYFCDYEGTAGNYLYWNGSYLSTCNFPYQQEVFKSQYFCNNPCNSSTYIYWNGSCISTCSSLLTVRVEAGLKYCDYPCNATSYLYWNGTCLPTCNYPYSSYTEGSILTRNYCSFKCLSTQYLYWDGTCQFSCDPPLIPKVTNGIKSCYFPCSSSDFLYYNGSCMHNCPKPYIQTSVGSLSYCGYPCTYTQYLFYNGSCVDLCPSPLIMSHGKNGEHYCSLPCPALQYYNEDTGECQSTCPESSRIQDDLYLRCMPAPALDPSDGLLTLLIASGKDQVPSLLILPKISQYVSYLNTPLPARLERVATTKGRSLLMMDFGIKMPESIKKAFVKRPLPALFERLNIHSSFLVNFFGDLMVLLILGLIGGMFKGMEILVLRIKKPKMAAIFDRLATVFLANFCLVLLIIYTNDILLYTYIDIKTINLNSSGDTVSLFIGVIFVLLLFATPILGVYVVLKYQKIRADAIESKDEKNYIAFRKKWRNLQFFYTSSKEDTLPQRLFYIIYLVRIILPAFISVLATSSATAQAAFQMIISLAITGYLIVVRPLKKRINAIQLYFYEGVTLVIHIAALALASVKPTNQLSNHETRTVIGDMIIVGSILINLLIIIVFAIKLVSETIALIKLHKSNKSYNRSDWSRLLVVFLQQSGYGFEEVSEDPENTEFDFDGRKAAAAAIAAAALEKAKAIDDQTVYEFVKPKAKPEKLSRVVPEGVAQKGPVEQGSVLLGAPPTYLDLNKEDVNKSTLPMRSQKHLFTRIKDLRSKKGANSTLQNLDDEDYSPVGSSPLTRFFTKKPNLGTVQPSIISLDVSHISSPDKQTPASPTKGLASLFNFANTEESPTKILDVDTTQKRNALDRLSRHMTMKK